MPTKTLKAVHRMTVPMKKTVKKAEKSLTANTIIQGKLAAKLELFCGPKTSDSKCQQAKKTPLVLVFATELNHAQELIPREVLFQLLQALGVTNSKVVVIDADRESDLANLEEIVTKSDKQMIWYNPLTDNSSKMKEEKEIDRLLLAADAAIVFNQHLDLINLLKSYGIVMIAPEATPVLQNYKPNEETGNAFLFLHKDVWGIFASVIRALETYKFPYDWQHIVKNILK